MNIHQYSTFFLKKQISLKENEHNFLNPCIQKLGLLQEEDTADHTLQ